MQIIIKTWPGSHRGRSGWRNAVTLIFSAFFLLSVLGDGFRASAVPGSTVGFVAVSSLVIQHQPRCIKRAERLSPSESSEKQDKHILSILVTAGSKTFAKAAGMKPH